MPDPLHDRHQMAGALRLIEREAESYLREIDQALVRPLREGPLDPELPIAGVGSLQALTELVAIARDGATGSAGPRFFHFVMGGGTPAALGADWLTSTLDQNAYNWISSPLGARLEQISTNWLKELFGLPRDWSAVITTGATMANFAGLAVARRWWGMQHGLDIDNRGFSGLPPVPVFASGYLHASAVKALGMLGIGRQQPQLVTKDAAGRVDLVGLEVALKALGGKPAILIATAGDVNTGDFDPVSDMAGLARKHGAWLHVDGAFGLFAAVSPTTRHLVDGVESADSVAVDGHKWLNVLRAYGRDGYRAMVERHLSLAQRIAYQVDAAPELERLAAVPLGQLAHDGRRRRPDRSGRAGARLEASLYGAGTLIGGRPESAGFGVGGSVPDSIACSSRRAIRFISRSPRSRRFTICSRISSWCIRWFIRALSSSSDLTLSS